MSTFTLADWYQPRRPEFLALKGALASSQGTAALLLEGPPGAGKTSLGEALAEGMDWPLLVGQFHEWTDADELFVGIDVAAAVAGEATKVRQSGLLARAAEITSTLEGGRRLVLILDEVDKAPERTEAMLLDWLQSGRVPVQPGVHLQTHQDRLVVLMTSNGQRPLSDALLRRVRRVQMGPLPVEVLDRLAHERSGVPAVVCRLVSRACRLAAERDEQVSSLQEIAQAARDCWEIAESAQDVAEIIRQLGARSGSGRGWTRSPDGRKLVGAIWGEIVKAKGVAS